MSRRRLSAQDVAVGDEHEPVLHTVTAEWVREYLSAVGAEWPDPLVEGELAPTTALAVLSFKPCEATYEVFSGRIHSTEEMIFFGPLLVGATIIVTSRVLDKYERRGRTFAVFETSFVDTRGPLVARGVAHVILPEEPSS